MSSTDQTELFDSIIEVAARELFEANGALLGPRLADAAAPDDHDIAASIGFTAPQVQGAILMTTRKEVVARAWPSELRHREPCEREVCDWAAELVNQLLGRVKNALQRFGLELEQSMPTVVTGKHVHRALSATNVARRYFFQTSDGSLLIYLDAIISMTLELSAEAPMGPAPEGEIHLF